VSFVVVWHRIVVILNGERVVFEDYRYDCCFSEKIRNSDNMVDEKEQFVAIRVDFERKNVEVESAYSLQ